MLAAPLGNQVLGLINRYLWHTISRQPWEDSAQQWPEQIRVLLAAIPNNKNKETPNEQVSAHY